MSLVDSVLVDCPHCGTRIEFQSKADPDPYLRCFTIEDAPTHILESVVNNPVYHVPCGRWVALIDKRFPPFVERPRPAPALMDVRPPNNPTIHDQGWRWWPDEQPFGEADLIAPTPER